VQNLIDRLPTLVFPICAVDGCIVHLIREMGPKHSWLLAQALPQSGAGTGWEQRVDWGSMVGWLVMLECELSQLGQYHRNLGTQNASSQVSCASER
jgi:hypothetical protein